MNFAALKQALRDQFDIDSARAGRYINQARAELDGRELWPYRLATATGASPLTIADLDVLLLVEDASNSFRPLEPADIRDLADTYGDLTTTGTARFFYVDGLTTVKTYPVGGTPSVRYYKVTTDLASPTDTPAAPARFHNLIVDIAAVRALRDAGNHQAATGLQAEVDRQLDVMRLSMFTSQIQGPLQGVRVTNGEW